MHDDVLLGQRAIFFSALTAALITAEALEFKAGVISIVISIIGALVSVLWYFVIARNIAGQFLWRLAVIELEKSYPIFASGGVMLWNVKRPEDDPRVESSRSELDLSKPVQMHNEVFHESRLKLSFRVSPNAANRYVPVVTLLGWLVIATLQTYLLFHP